MFSGRLVGSRRPRGPQARRGPRRRRGGVRPRGRGLEVPLRRVLERWTTSALDGALRLVVSPERYARSSRTTPRRGSERACGLCSSDGVAEGDVQAVNAALAVPLRARRRSGVVVPRGRGLRARGLPLAPGGPAATVRTDVENIGHWDGRPVRDLLALRGELAAWRIADGEVEPSPSADAERAISSSSSAGRR